MPSGVHKYKDKLYRVLGPVKMKDPVGRDWIDAVCYVPLCGRPICVREKKEFLARFESVPEDKADHFQALRDFKTVLDSGRPAC